MTERRRRIDTNRREEMLARIQEAGPDLVEGGIPELQRTSEAEFDDLRLSAEQYRRSRARGDTSIPVTIRLRPEQLRALRDGAAKRGFRGYQTYLKLLIDRWIAEAEAVESDADLVHITEEGGIEVIELKEGQVLLAIDTVGEVVRRSAYVLDPTRRLHPLPAQVVGVRRSPRQ